MVRRDTEVTEVVEGTTKAKNERRSEERHGVAEVVEGTTKTKNERRGEERHGGCRGCGGDDRG